MTLQKLLEGIKTVGGNFKPQTEIKNVRINSKDVEEGDLFICMRGTRDDGNAHLGEIDCRFVAVTETVPDNPKTEYVLVESARRAYALISSNYFSKPQNDMKFVAVVGTNGKTSTAHYVSSILSFCGFKTGLIGTEGHYILGEKVGASLTTPDPYEFYELLFKMRAKGVEVVVSEVSAHAIYLDKLYGIVADLAILTNVSQDHLDFFKDYKTYEETKLSYFTAEHVKKAVVNVDDKSGAKLLARLENSGLPHIAYGLNNPADAFAIDVSENVDGIKFVANVNDVVFDVRSGLYGMFNVYNLLAALTIAAEFGLTAEQLSSAARRVRAVKGRFSILRGEKGDIIIDYAHTPDGLKNLLITARSITKARLITVFGCGGDRDRGKRALMAAVAEKYSDFTVVTSDNPRFENPESIISDVEAGFSGTEFKSFTDRTEAIAFALSEMSEGDTVVIAGKGNEDYLEIRGKKLPYSDFDVARRWGQVR